MQFKAFSQYLQCLASFWFLRLIQFIQRRGTWWGYWKWFHDEENLPSGAPGNTPCTWEFKAVKVCKFHFPRLQVWDCFKSVHGEGDVLRTLQVSYNDLPASSYCGVWNVYSLYIVPEDQIVCIISSLSACQSDKPDHEEKIWLTAMFCLQRRGKPFQSQKPVSKHFFACLQSKALNRFFLVIW